MNGSYVHYVHHDVGVDLKGKVGTVLQCQCYTCVLNKNSTN